MEKKAKWWRIADSNILTDIAVWLILLVPLLVYVGIYEPFGFGRYAMFMFFLAILLLGSLFTFGGGAASRLVRHSSQSEGGSLGVDWWKQPIIWLIGIWWLVAILASMAGVNPARSWWGTVTRAEGLFFLTGLIILGINLLVLVRREAGWLKIFSIMTWVGAISSLYALLQPLKLPLMLTIADTGRASGLMGNPIFFGQLLLLTIFFTLYFIYTTKGKLRWAYVASLLLQLIGLLMTVSRGPLVGLAVGVVVWGIGWWFLHGRTNVRVRWPWLIGGLATIVVVVGSLLYLWPQQWQRLFVLGDTFRARLSIWETAWRAIMAKPWLGYGNENARYGLTHFYQSGLGDISLGETTADRAHNLILDQLLINGWIGLIIMVIVMGCLLWLLWRRFRLAKQQGNLALAVLIWSLLSTAVAYLIAIMFAFDVITTSVYITVIIAGIIFFVSPELPVSIKLPLIYPLTVCLVLVGLTFFDIKYLVPAWRIGQDVKSAQTAVKRNDYRGANQFYAKAQEPINPYRWSYLTTYPPFARQYALLLIDAKQLTPANAIIADGIRVLNNIQKNEPDRVGLFIEYPILYAVGSYVDPRYEVNVQKSFDELIKEFPNHEYLYVREAQSLIGIGEYSEAKQVLDRAAQFKSVPQEVWFWRAVVRIKLGDSDQVAITDDLRQSMAINRIVTSDPDVIRLVVNYLVQVREWQLAASYQEKLVDIVPNDLTELSNLLTIYRSEGKLDDVVRIAREIVAMDPTKQAEVEKFLQSIGRIL
ncbi:MAG: O-antigen ligase family protein [Patescibacteria group bacterium]